MCKLPGNVDLGSYESGQSRDWRMNLHHALLYQPVQVKAVIPKLPGTRSLRINPWTPSDKPAATICKTEAGYRLKEAEIKPTWQMYRMLTGQEKKKHCGLLRLDPEKPSPTADRSNKSPFLEMPFYPQFSGFPIRSFYVNFQGFMSIFKGILLQVRKEKTKNLRTFTFSTGLRPLHDLTLD